MKEMTKRLLCGLLCLILIFGVAVMPAAAAEVGNVEDMTEEEIVEYYGYAQVLVDFMVSMMDDPKFSAFQGSATPSLVRQVLVPIVAEMMGQVPELDTFMPLYGLEPTQENKRMLADEIYEIACVYYDEEHREGGTAESANRLAVIEAVRFALVTVVGLSNEEAYALAVAKYDVYIENISTIRLFGDNRYKTGIKVADEMKAALGVEKFDSVIVACGTGFADALSGSYLAAKKNAPILLVNPKGTSYETVVAYIRENLAENGTVYILGGIAAVPEHIESALKAACQVKRLEGSNRYGTSLVILQEAGVSVEQEILVCTGTGFADSLSASATGLPILLVRGDRSLNDSQKTFLTSLGAPCKFVIVGGESAVNQTIHEELSAYGSVERLSGRNRYDTSKLLAQKYFPSAELAVLAYARNYPDGLCGGPLAYVKKAPLILTEAKKESYAIEYTSACGITRGYVLGGPTLIPDASAVSIFSMTAPQQVLVR